MIPGLGVLNIDILAHRAIGFGPENSLEAMESALESGFGVEVDIRVAATGEFYVSHDPMPVQPERLWPRYIELFSRFPQRTVAVNVKDRGTARVAVKLFETEQIANGFAFDFELLGLPCPAGPYSGVRISDRAEENVDRVDLESAAFVWLDEMEQEWVTADVIEQIGSRARCYWVSPELHSRPWRHRWEALAPFTGLAGLCTDFASEFQQMYMSSR